MLTGYVSCIDSKQIIIKNQLSIINQLNRVEVIPNNHHTKRIGLKVTFIKNCFFCRQLNNGSGIHRQTRLLLFKNQ